MTPDSNGILMLEETDPITPFQTTINTLQAATSAVIGDLVEDISERPEPGDPGIPYRYAAGYIILTGTGSAVVTGSVTFPTGRFTVAPIVTVTRVGGSAPKAIPYVTGTGSASGINIGLYTGDGSTFTGTSTVYWQAVQMTPTSAEG